MSSSRSRNFRKRSGTDDVNGDEKPAAPPQSSAEPKLRAPKPPDRPKLLSFADNEEDDDGVALVRSSAPSTRPAAIHKLSSAKERSGPRVPVPSNVQPQTGQYTKEKIRELQKNARSLGTRTSKPKATSSPPLSDSTKSQKSQASAEPVIVLKGLVKPASPPSVSGRKEENDEQEDEEQDEDDGSGDQMRFSGLSIAMKAQDLSSGIPDQATIDAIRAKRERLRQSRGPLPDFISLDGGGVVGSRPPDGGSSDDEESDFRGRISLFADNKDGGTKKGVFEDIDERMVVSEPMASDRGYRDVVNDKEDDEDEEERRWEEEQFRKGLGKRIDEATGHLVSNSVLPGPAMHPPSSHLLAGATLGTPSGIGINISRSAEVISIPQQAEVAKRAFHENFSKLKETHNRTLNSLMRTDENLSEALSDITSLEKSLEAAGERFIFMQQLRDFISVISDFLQDKAPYIEELEEQMRKLHEVRASAALERRAADSADESSEVEAAVNAALSVLSKGSGATFLSAATSAAQAAAAAVRESSSLQVQLDEFGRDINLQNRMDSARRAEKRKRRKSRSEAKRMAQIERDTTYHRIEGESSTDESESEGDAYISSRDELLQTAEQVFSDAANDYSKLSNVKEKLEEWKRQYSLNYRDAYMSLSAPAIFSPYVRLELLHWDPLYKKTDFNDMDWHELLFDYGLPGKNSDYGPDDADANLIPVLVEKVALPILHHEIAHCWDMLSTRRTENAVFATSLVINYIPASSEGLRELLSVVRSRLDEAIAGLSVPTWSALVMKVVPGAAQLAAYRFGVSVRLLRNICLWKDILALPILEKLALDDLLGKKLLPHVRSIMPNIHDAVTRVERIIASLSGVWSGSSVTADHSHKLQPLVECVVELGKRLENRHTSGVSKEDTLGLARRVKKMLVDLNDYDRARAILKTFQLKEAL
ncbi:transcriptional repressor ILP1 [Dioscorea cayenensis subsp. rotundata]|uniref:Transcriptional repressor ILP1 n=1 Tax=Dioscorea cayennensis subsp. rotundata TaxID=55577 RepID=A0AB40CKZ9_DIOCR|nr:transcriptional repressor ILP1 [Dioscorea cayenensis subsp. rotundata]